MRGSVKFKLVKVYCTCFTPCICISFIIVGKGSLQLSLLTSHPADGLPVLGFFFFLSFFPYALCLCVVISFV